MINFKKIFVLFIILIFSVSLYISNFQGKSEEKTFVTINNKKIFLDVANNDEKRATGLMYRENLPENNGMIFLFDKVDKYNFWMKNVKIPLDMIFIYNNKIVKIYNNVPICKNDPCEIYPSDYKIDSVIELKGGFCKKYDVKPGMSVTFNNLPE